MAQSNEEAVVESPLEETTEPIFPGMVWIPGGTFLMGSDHHYRVGFVGVVPSFPMVSPSS